MTCPNCGTKLFLWIRLKGGGAFEYRACCCRCEDLVAAGQTIEELNRNLPSPVQKELTNVLDAVST